MNILMIHTAYNELPLLKYKFEYCKQNNLDLFVIDNLSNDGTEKWLKEKKVSHSFIDTNNSFDLRPLLTEMTNKIHHLRPNWVIYAGVDLFFESENGIRNTIKKADREGYTQIQNRMYTISNVGEGNDVKKNPFTTHFYAIKKSDQILISKYDLSIKISPDRIERKNIKIKQEGVIFEMHATKSIGERMETLRRRQKAWKNGLNKGYGTHYLEGRKRNFIHKKSDCIDIRSLKEEYYLYKKLAETFSDF